jgi:hypothetical protein
MINLDMIPSDQGADPFYAQLTAFTSVIKTLKGFTSVALGICKIPQFIFHTVHPFTTI